MKKLIMILTCIIASVGLSVAQTTRVSGTVIDDTGETVIGASVVAKGTTVGTVTDVDGNFSLNIPSDKKTLVVSLIGMKTKEVPAGTNLRIVLDNDSKLMDEVVVTAMGLTKDQKTLGYAASTVKSDEISKGQSGNVMSGLIGKVAGLNVSSAGGTGSSQKVIVRGISSFSTNQPLYIVDGSPMQNNFSGINTVNNSVDFGNAAADINPEDVESVTVLKGASATALYGSRAAQGVIMITTKKAKKNQKPTINYVGTFSAANVLRAPQTQDRFGQGWPQWASYENGSWGPKLDGLNHIWGAPVDGVYREKPFSYVKNNVKNFYETGFEMNNNISFTTAGEHTGITVSYGNLSSDGIMPGDADKYSRNSFSFRGNTVYDKLSISYNINYARKNITALSSGQGSDGATLFQNILQNPVDIDLQDLKDLSNPYNSVSNYYTFYAQNPYWIAKNNRNKYVDNHTYGNVDVSYEFIPGLKAVGRIGGDFLDSRRKSWNSKADIIPGSYAAGNKANAVGSYGEYNESREQLDVLAMLDGNYKLSNDVSLSGTMGWNYNYRSLYTIDSFLKGLVAPDWFSLENGSSKPVTTSRNYSRRTVGLLAQGEVAFRDYWYTSVSLRNDWSSTLPKQDRSFFYWGINSSLLLSDMLPQIKSDVLSFLKVRAAYGKTGNDANWYLTSDEIRPPEVYLGFGYLYFPLSGISGLTLGDRKGNGNLKPEITTETEFGFDIRLFDSRLKLDFSYYNKNTKDQIIAASQAFETGYSQFTRNIGEIVNKGVEVAVGIVPVQTKDWNWEFNVAFAKNNSKVKKLWDNGSEKILDYQIASGYQVTYHAIVGQPLGVFKVPKVATHEGKTIINPSTGFPQIESGEKEEIGNSNPKFVMGFVNRVSWKNLSLGVVVDWRSGGKFWSNTAEMLTWNGNATATMFNDRQPFLVPNSVKLVNGQYVENDIPITADNMYAFYAHSSNFSQYKNFVLSKSFVKLRELSISYTVPKSFLVKTPFKAMEVSAIGRNLLMWTPKENNFVDPETTNYGNDIGSELGEFTAGPSSRTFGGSIKVTF